MRSEEKSQLKKFSNRLQSFYANWSKHQSPEWMDAKLVVFCAPPSSRYRCAASSSGYQCDPDQDSLNLFEWLFREWLDDAYIVLSPTEIYAVCTDRNYDCSYNAKFLSSFADEAKKRVGVDFVVKGKDSGRTLRETLVAMANGFRRPMRPPGVKEKEKEMEKVVVGFIGDKAPEIELTKWMEWKDVTDAFCRLAGFK
ncbi:hypothetical protein M5K25_016278 [Dendrobium thyrsiflorum]|uniref:FACT complex subunit n=1 Tax=Dendrobium thyrsiflorum TaxID=117978 RepID=A0ABD0UJS9_DENTH